MIQIDEVMGEWKKYFAFEDREAVELCISAVASTRVASNPIWIFLVGPSGGLKTTILSSFNDLYPNHIIKLDMATSAVFASAKSTSPDLDLLSKIDGKCLMIKDFTSILQKNSWERDAIFGELRAIYDGDFHKHSGNIGEKSYENYRFTILAAVTNAIEEFYSVGQILGERFLKLKIGMDGRKAMEMALKNVGKEKEIMKNISRLTARIVEETRDGLAKRENFDVDGFSDILFDGAEFIARGRTAIRRDKDGNITTEPESEKPTRIIKQLRQLVAGCSVIEGREETEIAERIIKRIARDSIPAIRARILKILHKIGEGDVRDVRGMTKMSNHKVRQTLEDLAYLDMIWKEERNSGYIYKPKTEEKIC